MSTGSNSGGELTGRQACAACKHQRKKCEDDCVMAPYFPSEKVEDFKAVHKIFGVSNTSKLLKKLEDQNHRGAAAQSFIWEACTWKQDPVNGPLGKYRKLEREIELLRNALDQQQQQQQQKGYLAMPSTMEQESIVLDEGNNNNRLNSGNIKDQVEGLLPSYGGAMNYGYANQSLATDGSTSGTYTSLLQGQEVTERKGLVSNCVSASNYQPDMSQGKQVLSQGRGLHQGALIFDTFQYPMIQGGNANYTNNHGLTGPNLHGQARGQVAVFDPSVGQGQEITIGPVGADQIDPTFVDALPGYRRGGITQRYDSRFSSYNHQQHPMHVQRQAMSQGQNHHNFQQYSSNNGQSYDNVQDVELFNQVKSERQ